MLSKITQMKETRASKTAASTTSVALKQIDDMSPSQAVKQPSKLTSVLTLKRRQKVVDASLNAATSERLGEATPTCNTPRMERSSKIAPPMKGTTNGYTAATLPTGILMSPNFSRDLSGISQIPGNNSNVTIMGVPGVAQQNSLPSSPCTIAAPSSTRAYADIRGSRKSPGVQSTHSYDQRYQINQKPCNGTLKMSGSASITSINQANTAYHYPQQRMMMYDRFLLTSSSLNLPYSPPTSRLATPQLQRQPRYNGRRELVKNSTQAVYPQTQLTRTMRPSFVDDAQATSVCSSSANSETSRDSGIGSDKPSKSPDEYKESTVLVPSSDIRGYSTPQCSVRSNRLRAQRATSVTKGNCYENMSNGVQETPTCLRRMNSNLRGRDNENKPTSRLFAMTNVKPGTRITPMSSRRVSMESVLKSSSPSSQASSPSTTPRGSWDITETGSNTSRSSRCATHPLEGPTTAAKISRGTSQSKIATISRSGSLTARNASSMIEGRIPRPTNLTGDPLELANCTLKQVLDHPKECEDECGGKRSTRGLPQRPQRLSSLPAESHSQLKGTEDVGNSRAKTLSPPPIDKENLPSELKNDSISGTSTCTLAQNTESTSTMQLVGHELQEEGILVNSLTEGTAPASVWALNTNRRSDDRHFRRLLVAPPVASVAPLLSLTKPEVTSPEAKTMCIPSLIVDGSIEDEKSIRYGSASPRPRLIRPCLSTARTCTGEDPVYGCLQASPLSHMKLPYSNSAGVKKRLQVMPVGEASSVSPSIPLGNIAKANEISSSQNQLTTSVYLDHGSINSTYELTGSHFSLASSLPPAAKLQTELDIANQKISALTCHLSANVTVVHAFEQSLQSMSSRLHQLTTSSAIKERELQELRRLVGRLRYGTALEQMWSRNGKLPNGTMELTQSYEYAKGDSRCLLLPSDVHPSESQTSLLPTSSSSYQDINKLIQSGQLQGRIIQNQETLEQIFQRNSKKHGWLRNSFNRAFGRSKSREPIDRSKLTSNSTQELSVLGQSSANCRQSPSSSMTDDNCPQLTSISACNFGVQSVSVADLACLQHQLADKDHRLTDAQLESLSRFHQLQQMQELLQGFQEEIAMLRKENEQLHRAVDSVSRESGDMVTGATIFTKPNTLELLRELHGLDKERREGCFGVPLFLQLGSGVAPCSSEEGNSTHHSWPAPSTPRMAPVLSNAMVTHSPNPSARIHVPGNGGNSKETSTVAVYGVADLTKLHLLGQLILDSPPTVQQVREETKRVFQTYLRYLDTESQLGLGSDSISMLVVKCLQEDKSGDASCTQDYIMKLDAPDACELQRPRGDIDEALAGVLANSGQGSLLRVTILLHDNAYAVGGHEETDSSINRNSTAAIAWISLLPCSLLHKMIESLLANKCVIIYGPKGSGKLEFGYILMDSMTRMFPGFWTNRPSVHHCQFRWGQNARAELRQVLLNALSMEGLLILRIQRNFLADLVQVISDLNFHRHPKKVLLLIITDGIQFPDEPTRSPNCPGIFPFLADFRSTGSYMHRCMKQRFSQFAFQCLEAERRSMKKPMCQMPLQQHELAHLTEIFDWLPTFWLRMVCLKRQSNATPVETYPISPFRLLACPFTLSASWLWFRELWEAEISSFLQVEQEHRVSSSSIPSSGARNTARIDPSITRWIFSTWPWPELPSCVNGLPNLQETSSSTHRHRRLSQSNAISQSLGMLSIFNGKDPMSNSGLNPSPPALPLLYPEEADEENQYIPSARESCATLYDSSCSLPVLVSSTGCDKEPCMPRLFLKNVPITGVDNGGRF